MRNKGLAAVVVAAATLGLAGEAAATEWDVSLWGKRRAFTEHVEKLAELVDAKTNGEFTLNISYGGLSKSRENLDGIAQGKFEMAQFCAGYHPIKNPSITVLELPFLGVSSLEQEIAVSRAVYEHPITQADMARWDATLLMPSPLPQYNILGTGIPPTKLADFNGMAVRATGGIGKAIEALGGTLVPIPAPDVQGALEAGIVKAVSFAPHAHMAFNTIESGTWWTANLNPGTVNCPVVVNTIAMAQLPPEHRDALLSSVDEALKHYVDAYNGFDHGGLGARVGRTGHRASHHSGRHTRRHRRRRRQTRRCRMDCGKQCTWPPRARALRPCDLDYSQHQVTATSPDVAALSAATSNQEISPKHHFTQETQISLLTPWKRLLLSLPLNEEPQVALEIVVLVGKWRMGR